MKNIVNMKDIVLGLIILVFAFHHFLKPSSPKPVVSTNYVTQVKIVTNDMIKTIEKPIFLWTEIVLTRTNTITKTNWVNYNVVSKRIQ